MGKVNIFVADGFEEVEGLTVVDILRRAGINTVITSITGDRNVTSSHNIRIVADRLFEEEDYSDTEAIVLPGGMPGTTNLAAHEPLKRLIDSCVSEGKLVTAICAAPSVLGQMGLLNGKRAVCYPGFEDRLEGATVTDNGVEVDGNIITGNGLGSAIDFALAITSRLVGEDKADEIARAIMYRK